MSNASYRNPKAARGDIAIRLYCPINCRNGFDTFIPIFEGFARAETCLMFDMDGKKLCPQGVYCLRLGL